MSAAVIGDDFRLRRQPLNHGVPDRAVERERMNQGQPWGIRAGSMMNGI